MKKIVTYALAAYGAVGVITLLNFKFGKSTNALNARLLEESNDIVYKLYTRD